MSEKSADTVKIINQFRSRTGFVFELKAESARLTVRIAQRQSPSDPGEWSAEACPTSESDSTPMVAWGPTRRDALHAVGLCWIAKAKELGLPTFDWDAVATALSDVRAV